MTGFEPATTRPPDVYSTGLSYIPNSVCVCEGVGVGVCEGVCVNKLCFTAVHTKQHFRNLFVLRVEFLILGFINLVEVFNYLKQRGTFKYGTSGNRKEMFFIRV